MWLIDYATSCEVEDNSAALFVGNIVQRQVPPEVPEAQDVSQQSVAANRARSEIHKVDRGGFSSNVSNWFASYICNGCKQKEYIKAQYTVMTMSIVQLERLLEKKKNKANAAGAGQVYTNCFLVSNVTSDCDVDSGATSHITPNLKSFTHLDKSHRSHVLVADGRSLDAVGIGQVKVKLFTGSGEKTLDLRHVLYGPGLKASLFST